MWNRLLLFDIDGTLIKIGKSKHGKAFEYAITLHTGKHIPIMKADPFGRTDTGILMNMLAIAGYSKYEAEIMIPQIYETMIGYYIEKEIDLRPYVFQGALSSIKKLTCHGNFLLSLLTGNHEVIGWQKLKKADIDKYFKVGGFGNEALDRNELVDIVLSKIRKLHGFSFPKKDVVIIGDTPRDIECGKKNGAITIAVATGSFSKEQLIQFGADLVLEDLGAYENIMELIS